MGVLLHGLLDVSYGLIEIFLNLEFWQIVLHISVWIVFGINDIPGC